LSGIELQATEVWEETPKQGSDSDVKRNRLPYANRKAPRGMRRGFRQCSGSQGWLQGWLVR